MKRLVLFVLGIIVCCLPLGADIVKTVKIEDVLSQEMDEKTLIFFNIAEVLMDTEASLGSQAWRKYLRSRVEPRLHDELTLFVFQHVPPKTPEIATADVLAHLQQRGLPVFAFTSRGRHEWYGTQVADVDLITEQLLRQIRIDFSQTSLPASFAHIDTVFGDYFHEGIIYATNAFDKGEMLVKFLDAANLYPSKIIFIDDKADSLKSVEEVLQERGIPLTGFAYSRTSLNHAHFDPMIANIQLDWLISYGQSLTDEEADQMKALLDPQLDHEEYFHQIVEKWKHGRKQH